jgi:predicted DNA-binding transcriptional regulator AlpA
VEQTNVVAILRPRAAWEKLGVSRTTFYDEFVNKGRVRLLNLGERARGVPDDEIETLINELRAERDAAPRDDRGRFANPRRTARRELA